MEIAAYAAKNVAEGATALYAGLTTPTAPLRATFRRVRAPPLPRSSHSINVIGGRAYIFGGEVTPREPVGNEMHVVTLPSAELQDADHVAVPAKGPEVPCPRVGHTASAIGQRIYVFGGRGGASMAALEEHGRVWVFDTTTLTWGFLDPNPLSPFPAARSYHAAASSPRPLPAPQPTNPAAALDPPDTTTSAPSAAPSPHPPDSHGTLFVHGGCLSSGGRASDLWSFDVSSRSWSALPSAPGPARGGTCLALLKDRLYRFGGFDGARELGGAVDHLDLSGGTFADKGGRGEMSLAPAPPGRWETQGFGVAGGGGGGKEDGMAARSVCGFVPVSTGQGRNYLVVLGGETTPSKEGHAGAGRFLDDVWSLQVRPEGATAASVKDAVRGVLIGRETGEEECVQVRYYDGEGVLVQEGQGKPMGARGWFACDRVGDVAGPGSVIVWGGVNEKNERLGDGWIISFE